MRREGFNFEKQFSRDFLESLNLPYLIISTQDIKELDGKIDILIFSDLFPNVEKIKKTFTVILQESNVKDISEFGDSNYLFNLRLVYGPFSSQKVEKYGSFFEIGNPRFDNSFKNFLDQKKINYIKKGLDPKKKNLLYLPTLDNFSTFHLFLKKVIELRSKYNILFKIQHFSIENEFLEINKIYKNLKEIFHIGTDVDSLYDLADLVICDFGDGIFDAIYLQKPVIFLQKNDLNNKENYFLERFFKRIVFDPIIKDPNKLEDKISILLKDPQIYLEKNSILRKDFFNFEISSGKDAAKLIKKSVERFYLNKNKFNVRKTLNELIFKNKKNALLKKKFLVLIFFNKIKPYVKKLINYLTSKLKNIINY